MRSNRSGVAIVALMLQVTLQLSGTAQELEHKSTMTLEGSNVRIEDAALRHVIERGLARSSTFRDLIAELNASDVIVHLTRSQMPERVRGYLNHRITATGGRRYLRIAVDARGSESRVISLVAHELQHALEVARVPEVGRSRDVEAFFREISDLGCLQVQCFETSAAVKVQADVIRQLD